MEYTSFTNFDENDYKATEWNIAVLHMLMKMYINRQYGIRPFFYALMKMYTKL